MAFEFVKVVLMVEDDDKVSFTLNICKKKPPCATNTKVNPDLMKGGAWVIKKFNGKDKMIRMW